MPGKAAGKGKNAGGEDEPERSGFFLRKKRGAGFPRGGKRREPDGVVRRFSGVGRDRKAPGRQIFERFRGISQLADGRSGERIPAVGAGTGKRGGCA